jgi:hypothetical protein
MRLTGWINSTNKHKLNPIYFFLVAGKTGKYDKNISPSKKEMHRLIVQHSNHYLHRHSSFMAERR